MINRHYPIEGRFKIALTNEIMPYLTQLKGQFTQYQLNHISGFSSVHAIRLYELFTQYKRLGERYISIEDLKKWLQLEDKYDRYNNLNQWVLLPALAEINEKSDLFVEYEPSRRQRRRGTAAPSLETGRGARHSVRQAGRQRRGRRPQPR